MDEHLSPDLIFRAVDDELTSAECFGCESHLAVCEVCREQVESLRELSVDIESTVAASPLPMLTGQRWQLEKALGVAAAPVAALQNPARVMRRFGWGVGMAATLALGVLLAPKHEVAPPAATVERAIKAPDNSQLESIEVDGETFQPVPYSNSDLSTANPHIVQMQVPVSSLSDVGIVIEPVSDRFSAGSDLERSVLADVLVGADGQPRGVHVLGSE